MKRAAACPISRNKVDERIARLNGLVSLLFVLGGMAFPILWLVIAVDFLIRSINPCSSLVSQFNKQVMANFKGKPVLIDAAPKKFAAGMGLTMSTLLYVSNYYQLGGLTNFILIFFIAAISLEVLFKYCIGCKIYSILFNLKIVK